MTAADDSLKYFFHRFSEKRRLGISCQSSARRRTHMKHQAVCSSKIKVIEIKMPPAAILLGCLRRKTICIYMLLLYMFDPLALNKC